MTKPDWLTDWKYRYRPKAFDWSQFNAVRDDNGKIVPAEFVEEDGDYGRFRVLGTHNCGGAFWGRGEKWHFIKDGTSPIGLTLIHHDFAEKPQPSPGMVERMVECVRYLIWDGSTRERRDEARAILAELEPVQPVDPDLELAREIVQSCMKDRPKNEPLDYALAAIKRVRDELKAQEGKL